jgi:arginyl-tRNA synthetase
MGLLGLALAMVSAQKVNAVLHLELEKRLHAALLTSHPGSNINAVRVMPAPDTKFGDYQCNALMTLARVLGVAPRQLATEVVAQLNVSDLCEPVEIAGPGFLNFRLKPDAIAAVLAAAARGEHLFFVPAGATARTYVVDFSSPNVAKPMHVGHIRSTGIGDSLVKVLRRLGHRVITDNHLGDWGTQFGMLLLGWKTRLDPKALAADPIAELERLYKEVNALCDDSKPTFDPAIRDTAKNELVKLQAGDEENLGIWGEMQRLSQLQFDSVYGRLGVGFDYTLGESFYNPWLQGVVDELVARGLARSSKDAVAVFADTLWPDTANRPAPKDNAFLVQKDGEWVDQPALIKKSDGGFNYMTTDLATIAHRVREWQPDEIIYVVDDRQAAHFRQLFTIAAHWHPDWTARTRLTHVGFGKICGADKKPLKTRDGNTPKLAALLDEAEDRALQLVTEKRPELPEARRKEIARVVGLGALKYQDLLPHRTSDYVFNWDKMLALTGNTAPYVQYQFTRAAKVVRDGRGQDLGRISSPKVVLAEDQELALAKLLLNYGHTLNRVAEDYCPNFLCNYVYELASAYSRFYDNCPVLKAEEPTRASRLLLCELTAKVLQEGLALLGIETIDEM